MAQGKNMDLSFVDSGSLFLIAGPCAVESESVIMTTAEHLVKMSEELNLSIVFKSSYKKANRTSLNSFTGIGDQKALTILKKVKDDFGIPVLTDVHSAEEAKRAADYVDVLQIPAFLCRQTELLVAAAKTGKPVNIKKGQFMSPESMGFAVEKVKKSGKGGAWLTERGTTFGYGDLVVDFRGIPTMKNFGVPVVLDCTHSVQQPNKAQGVTGGRPEMISTLAKAGVAVGVDGLFIETHPNPSEALSDGANMMKLEELKPLLEEILRIKSSLR